MLGLGDLAGNFFQSRANAVSGDGSVIVGQGYGFLPEAVVWDFVHGLRQFGDVLVDEYGLPHDLGGWRHLTSITSVSADGLTFGGYGLNPQGQIEGWIAHLDHPLVPEPSSLALAALGLAATVIVWRRRATHPRP
jgi:hypothetical protein